MGIRHLRRGVAGNTVLVHICYCTKFGRCSNRFDTGIGDSKNLGRLGPAPWDVGVADPLETRFSCVTTQKLGHARSNRTSVISGDPADSVVKSR